MTTQNPFDPAYTWPAIVRPEETPEETMARLQAQADLLMVPLCVFCSPSMEVAAMAPGATLPRAVGIIHEPGCPDGEVE